MSPVPEPPGPGHRTEGAALPQPGAGTALAAQAPLTALRHLETGPRGLTEAEAEERLARHGENTPPAWHTPSLARRLVQRVREPFTAVLLLLGLVSAAIGSVGTACVILALVTVSCVLRAGGELRADRSVAGLRALVTGTVTVLRRRDTYAARPDERELPVADLVPGDVIRLGPGDLVPADVLLLSSTGLVVGQAQLTGESGGRSASARRPPEAAGPARDNSVPRPRPGSRTPAPPSSASRICASRAVPCSREEGARWCSPPARRPDWPPGTSTPVRGRAPSTGRCTAPPGSWSGSCC